MGEASSTTHCNAQAWSCTAGTLYVDRVPHYVLCITEMTKLWYEGLPHSRNVKTSSAATETGEEWRAAGGGGGGRQASRGSCALRELQAGAGEEDQSFLGRGLSQRLILERRDG